MTAVEKQDDEQARATRFGKLPPRVRPDERVDLVATEAPRDRPEPVGGEDYWMLRVAGG